MTGEACLDISSSLRIGIIDTGVNPWHSQVRGKISGLRIYLDATGKICEDDDFRDLVGHGTAVAGVLRQQLPDAELFAIRVFDEEFNAYPSLVARAILRAAAEGCTIINMSLGMLPGPGSKVLEEACRDVLDAGIVLVASGHPEKPDLLPASLPGVAGVIAADRLQPGEIEVGQTGSYRYAASGRSLQLKDLQDSNLWGNSFACARVCLAFALKAEVGQKTLEPST